MLVSVQFPAIFFQKTFVSEGITQQGHSWQELAPHYATEPKVSEVNEPWKLRTPYWAWSLVSARTFGQPSYAIKEEKVGVYVLEGWRSVLLVPFPGSHFAHKDTRRMLKISKRENLHLPHYQLWSMLLLRLGFIFSGKSLMQALREHQPACTYGGPYLSDSPFSAVLQAPSSLNPRSTTPLQLVLGEIFGSQRLHSKLKELDQWVFPSQLSTEHSSQGNCCGPLLSGQPHGCALPQPIPNRWPTCESGLPGLEAADTGNSPFPFL